MRKEIQEWGSDLCALFTTLLAAAILGGALPAAASPCTDIANLSLPDTTITSAQDIAPPPGTFPAFCWVTATLTPTFDSGIQVAVWMPAAGWNGRFEGVGGAGFQGVINYDAMAPALLQGYAVANTDQGTGSSGCTFLFCGGAGNQGNPVAILAGEPAAPSVGLYGHPERIKDLGYRAIHLMTTRAKSIVKAYYGRPAHHAYFSGCSAGGQNGLMEAQRFPNDYDGILVGASSYNRTHFHVISPWNWQHAHGTADSFIQPEQMVLINNAVLAQCAGQDGGLRSDAFLTDPRDCRFDPAQLQCMGGKSPPACLTPNQVRVVQQSYAGPSNPRTGDLIYPGYERGSEVPFIGALGLLFNEALPEPAFDGPFYWVFGPSFGNAESAHNYLNFDFDRDVATADRVLAADLNATSTDLDEFRERGGKLVMYHGWADSVVPGQVSINYALAVAANKESGHRSKGEEGGLRRQETFLRLFMAPGMGHCGGGPGPNVFGGVQNQGGPNDADHNALSALVQWVEQGTEPDQIVATKFVNDDPAQGIAAQRPLCMFPKVAVYKGHGDPTIADSFFCRRDNDHDANQMPAPEYGP